MGDDNKPLEDRLGKDASLQSGKIQDYDSILSRYIGCKVRYTNSRIEEERHPLLLDVVGVLYCGLDHDPENAKDGVHRYNVDTGQECIVLIPGGRGTLTFGEEKYELSRLVRPKK
jgi:hypothetical protein